MNVEFFQNLFAKKDVVGDIISLNQTEDRHWHGVHQNKVPESTALNFSEVLNRALLKVNDQNVKAEKLAQQLIADPSSVQPHTVTIAAEKARMSLMFTKTVTDLAVKTYKELVNLR